MRELAVEVGRPKKKCSTCGTLIGGLLQQIRINPRWRIVENSLCAYFIAFDGSAELWRRAHGGGRFAHDARSLLFSFFVELATTTTT